MGKIEFLPTALDALAIPFRIEKHLDRSLLQSLQGNELEFRFRFDLPKPGQGRHLGE